MRKLSPLAALALCAACSGSPTLEMTVSPASIGGDGASPVTVEVKLTRGGSPVDGTVHLTTSNGRFKDNSSGGDPTVSDLAVSGGAATAVIIPPRVGRGTIDIKATASVDGTALSKAFSVTLTPAGGLAHGLTFTCQKQNIGAFVTPREALHVLCSAVALDVSGHEIPNASIETMAEAGHLDWVTDEAGAQKLVYTVDINSPPPKDVDPFDSTGKPRPCTATCNGDPSACDGEPCWFEANLTHNPRDGLVTLIAAVPGVSAIDDRGEPYVDADDSGSHESGENYIDYNANGKYDPPSGATKERMIWREVRMVWSGDADVSTTSHGSKFAVSGSGTTKTVTLQLNDKNFNTLAADGQAGADLIALTSASCNNGGTITLPASLQLEQTKPGIKLVADSDSSVPGGIDGAGFPSSYRVGSDYTFHASIDAAGNTCSIEAALTRDYDPGVSGLFDSTGALGTEQVSGNVTF